MLEQRANMLESHTNVLERHEDLSEQRTNRAQSHTNMLERHEDLPERPANTSESHGNVSKQRVKMQVYCVSRLSPEKGIDILLEAARKLPEIDFLIAGDGPEREILENSSSPNVTFLGFVKDIPDLLSQADVLCVPSRSEGLGLAALEAMAAGVPVVASRVGGLPEVILDGETGLLFTSEDPEALKIALQTLLDNPERRKAMGEAGRKRAESVFDAKTMQKKTRAVWEEAAR